MYFVQTDMLLVFGYCQENFRASARVYSELFPNHRLPNHQTFAAVAKWVTLLPQRLITDVNVWIEILELVVKDS